MHILIVHSQYLTAAAGGGSRFNEFARYWRAAGHDVTVLASMTRYTSGEQEERFKGRWRVEETGASGERIIRTFATRGGHTGLVGRVRNYLSFAISATDAGLRMVGKPDVVISTSPPLFVALPGYIVSRLKGVPWVFEVRDLWPDFAVEMGMLRSPLYRKAAYWLESFAYRNAQAVVPLTPAFAETLEEKGVPKSKTVVITNGADLEMFESPAEDPQAIRREMGWQDKFVLLYSGAHGPANALDQILDAAQLTHGDTRLHWALVGDGLERSRLELEAHNRGLDNVQFLPEQPKGRMPALVHAADVGLAVLKDLDGFTKVYPNKVFDYMAAGKPSIVAIDGQARQLVEDAQAGLFVPPESPSSLAAAARYLSLDAEEVLRMGARGHDYVVEHFNRRTLAENYIELLDALVEHRRPLIRGNRRLSESKTKTTNADSAPNGTRPS